MKQTWNWKHKLIWLSLFAIAMALLESAIVIHLRQIYYPDNILSIFPIRLLSLRDLLIELSRETATVVMMFAVAVLVEKKKIIRVFACFVFLFGLWDIFYYIWLKVFINWPLSWAEWDVLFLIPWIWIGPWICPALIALAFVIWGTWIIISKREMKFRVLTLVLFITGCILELITFLTPPLIILLTSGSDGLTTYLPQNYLWWLFIPGYLIMCTGLAGVLLEK